MSSNLFSLETLLVVLVPASFMTLGSIATLCLGISETLQAVMQNFSAGLLITAVANELFPLLDTGSPNANRPPNEIESYVGLSAGFAIGLIFMFGLEKLIDHDEEEDKEQVMQHPNRSPLLKCVIDDDKIESVLPTFKEDCKIMMQHANSFLELVHKGASRDVLDRAIHTLGSLTHATGRHLKKAVPTLDEASLSRLLFHAGELVEQGKELERQQSHEGAVRALNAFDGTVSHLHEHAERVKFSRWRPMGLPPRDPSVILSEQIPWGVVACVVIDAAVDGLLIGMAYSAAAQAGISMAIATSIEMGFLGLSLSATIQNSTRSTCKHMAVVLIAPVFLVGFGLLGYLAGGYLSEDPGVFIGFIAFSIVALLFLVTQELLTEAREVAGESIIVNSVFFVGIFGGIVLNRVLA